jgi:hypothetical protein
MFEALEAKFGHAHAPLRGQTPSELQGGSIIREVMDPAFLKEHLDTVRTRASQRPGATQLPQVGYDGAFPSSSRPSSVLGGPRVAFERPLYSGTKSRRRHWSGHCGMASARARTREGTYGSE